MDTNLQLILPSLVLPLMLSVAVSGLSRWRREILWALPVLWVLPYFWIKGWSVPLLPGEASDWLWLLTIVSVVFGVRAGATSVTQRSRMLIPQFALLAVAIILLSWPVLRFQLTLALSLELLVAFIAGAVLLYAASSNRAASPALTLAVSSGGLALVTALGGSVLVGQLAGALASMLGAFALYEVYQRFSGKTLHQVQWLPLLQIYLALLLIARIYAEIPLLSFVLLLLAPTAGLLVRGRFAFLGSVASAAIALAWLLATADSSSYY